MRAIAAFPSYLQAKAAVDIPQWLFQRLAEESAGLSEAAEAGTEGQGHGDRSPCACELLALRGAAEAELAMAAQKGTHSRPGKLPAGKALPVICRTGIQESSAALHAAQDPTFPRLCGLLCDSGVPDRLVGLTR